MKTKKEMINYLRKKKLPASIGNSTKVLSHVYKGQRILEKAKSLNTLNDIKLNKKKRK